MLRAALVFMLALAAPAVFAADPAPPMTAEEKEAELEPLFDALEHAPNEAEARAIEGAIWMIWISGPDEESTRRLADAMQRIQGYDFAGALELLDPLAEEYPEFSEVWNQRAFAHFLREEYDQALADLDRTLELEPRHFGALAGKARTLMRQGRMMLGQKALRRAIDIHPWLRERSMLIEVPSEDI